MFENIIAQERVIHEICTAVETGTLPGALLFSGNHFTGKMSTALELGRVLTCTGDRSWNCPCKSCENQRLMIHPYVQLLGKGSFLDEIISCAEILKKSQPLYARYMFIRSVRKLLKRFDPVLWEGNETKFKQLSGNALKAEEILREIKTDEEQEIKDIDKKIDRIVTECTKIIEGSGTENIPISQIRRINTWSRTASDSAKIIIIENADSMGDSSRNSLLKLLEEPPEDCFFILTTSRKGAIIPTILSRLRVFNFNERTRAESEEVIRKIFRENGSAYRDIKEYFLSSQTDTVKIKELAAAYVESLISHSRKLLDDIGDFKNIQKSKRMFIIFIEECAALIHEKFRTGIICKEPALELNSRLNSMKEQRELYNQSSQLLLESLLYRGVN